MYWRHFNLTAEPFSLTPDPSFLYLSPVHAEAFAAMTMGLRERRGLITTIGEVGTGKTTLVYSLLSGLGPEIHTAYISNARLSFDGILRLALRDFGVACESTSSADLLDAFNKFLLDCATQGTTAALVIDEAQNLSQETFEDLRLLSNFETYTHKLLQIVLVGQPELDAKLREPALRQVAERVAVRCVVNPLTRAQARQYLEHRLAAVNGSLDLFTASALRLLIATSRGIPRSLNILAHNSMLFAYGEECDRVERRFVSAAIREKQGNTIVRLWRRPKRAPAVVSSTPTRARDLRSCWALGGAALAGLTVGLLLAGTDLGASRNEQRSEQEKSPERAHTAERTPSAAVIEPEAAPSAEVAAGAAKKEREAADASATQPPLPAVEAAPAPTPTPEPVASVPAEAPAVAAVEPPAQPSVAAEVVAEATAPAAVLPAPQPLPMPAAPLAPSQPEPVPAVVPQAPVAPLAAAEPPAVQPVAPAVVVAPPVPVAAEAAAALAPVAAKPATPASATPAARAQAARTTATRTAAAAQPTQRMVTVDAPTRNRRPAQQPPASAPTRVATRASALVPPAGVKPPASAPAAETASAQESATVVTVPAGSSLSDLMLAVYGQYNSQMMERVQAVNPQVTDPDVIIAGDRLRFPDKASANPAAATEAR